MNPTQYRLIMVCLFTFAYATIIAQENTISADKDWYSQQALIRKNSEADAIIRIGDIDHFGFNWTQQADPFCASSYFAHAGIFKSNASDASGFDQVLFSSKYNSKEKHTCGSDDYAKFYNPDVHSREKKTLGNFLLPTSSLKGLIIKDASLQMFVDGFQASTYCSKFQLLLNDIRFTEGEQVLNSLNQDGKAGQLINMPISQEFYEALSSGNPLRIRIDESKGSADGFVIDFIRLVVNKNSRAECTGTLKGVVILDNADEQPLAGVIVTLPDNTNTTTNANGEFVFNNVSRGFMVLNASAKGYEDATGIADIIPLQKEFSDITIALIPGKKGLHFFEKSITVGETISMDNLSFKEGSRLVIEGKAEEELGKINAFLKQYPNAEIELIGYAAAGNDEYSNRLLAFKKVKMCKDYIVRMGIEANRIKAIGYARKKANLPANTDPSSFNITHIEMRVKKI